MKTRKHLSSEQKAAILREWIESGLSIGELAEKHYVTPNDLYRWRKQLLENASEIFSRKRSDSSTRKEQARIQELEAKLKQRNTLISELAQENLELKKNTDGAI
jgi:transposase-like protein